MAEMNDLSYLANLSQEDYEAERLRILSEAIMHIPEEYRGQCIKLQEKLSDYRDTHSPEEYMCYIAALMSDGIENLDDLRSFVKEHNGEVPTIKPVQDR
jgi:hypothetical protein